MSNDSAELLLRSKVKMLDVGGARRWYRRQLTYNGQTFLLSCVRRRLSLDDMPTLRQVRVTKDEFRGNHS